MRFVATADWQLGMTAHYLSDEARPRFQQARFDAVRRIGELATQKGADFVVVCGDVFESNQLDRAVLSRTFEALDSYSVPVVLLPGNHDPLDAVSIYDSARFRERAPENVHVLRSAETFAVAPGVQVVGAPWYSKFPGRDLVAEALAGLEAPPPGVVRVFAGHGAVDSLGLGSTNPATIGLEPLQQALEGGLVDVAVLGDRHGTMEVAPAVWYCGTQEVTARDEDNPGNVLLVDVEAGHAPRVEVVPVGRWQFLVIEEQLDSVGDVEVLARRLGDISRKDRSAIWLHLSGTLNAPAYARLETVIDEASDVFAHLDYWERRTDLAILADGEDFSGLGLSSFAQAALEDLVELSEGTGEEALVARDALALLYRLAGGGR